MEDFEFNPPEEKINNLDKPMNFSICDNEINNKESFFKFDKDDKDIIELIFEGGAEKYLENLENEINNLTKIEKSIENNDISYISPFKIKNTNEIASYPLKFDEKKLSKKLKNFFLSAYQLISEKYYNEDKIDKNLKDNKNLLNLINKILLEYNNDNCEFSFLYSEENNRLYPNFFELHLKVIHKIKDFHGLITIKILFKIELKMFITSGNAEINILKYLICYGDSDKEIMRKPDFICFLINNTLGNYSITYCSCGDCMNCKNRNKPKPFDKLLIYLKKENNIRDNIFYTQLWYGKYNKYRNESNYKCSFCKEFYKKKLNIVKLFCNPDLDPDHSCLFWICRDCYYNKCKIKLNELCPNCKKFTINFTQTMRIFKYYKWKHNH